MFEYIETLLAAGCVAGVFGILYGLQVCLTSILEEREQKMANLNLRTLEALAGYLNEFIHNLDEMPDFKDWDKARRVSNLLYSEIFDMAEDKSVFIDGLDVDERDSFIEEVLKRDDP